MKKYYFCLISANEQLRHSSEGNNVLGQTPTPALKIRYAYLKLQDLNVMKVCLYPHCEVLQKSLYSVIIRFNYIN